MVNMKGNPNTMELPFFPLPAPSPTFLGKLTLSNTLPKSNTKRGDVLWQLTKYPID